MFQKRFVLEKAVEFGVPLVFVNPSIPLKFVLAVVRLRLSLMTTFCVGGFFACPVCGFSLDRDFVAVLNLLGLFPFSPKADESLVEGSVNPVTLVVEANLLHHKNSLVVIIQSLKQK